MNHKYFLFILLSLTGLHAGISQTMGEQNDRNSDLLSRFRLSFGHVNLLVDDDNYEFEYFFFNLSFRSSGFKRTSDLFNIKFAFEPGVNGLFISHKYVDKVNLYFTPYAKFGPEINFSGNLFLGASFGIVLATYEDSFFPLPFLGLNGFYLFELDENISIEFESGFHTTFSPDKLPFLFYFTAGISIL